ncbi:MAG: rhomboid family intramembrane serine protease [Limisphaerales bacterium]|jgi:membrane associated rhomboid family serine protease
MLEDRSYMREPEWRPEASRSGISLCLTLILINVACYILQHTVRGFEETLALFPQRLQNGNVWELLSYQFLHGGLFHLLINCAMIWFAGRQIEEALGKAKFLVLYLVAGIFGGLLQCALSWSGFLPPAGVVGASAGIFGLIAAFAMVYWERELTFLIMFVIPVRMKAKYLLIALAVIGVLGVISKEGGIAHGAHLGGMIWGVLFILLFIQGGTYSGAEPWWDQLRDRFSSGHRRKVVTIDGGARAYSRGQIKAEEVDEIDFVESEVDPILDKISEKGIQSLTERERKILEQARKKMRR